MGFLWRILLPVLLLHESYGWRSFYRGRRVGGNLGLPNGEELESTKKVTEEWFVQTLDHFSPTDMSQWKQRFFTNTEFYDPSTGGPVFLMIGGEGEASIKWMTNGAWIDYAKQFGALCFQLEHRYYGKSHPTEDLSTKNLRYLTSQQALADLASFITAMNERYELSPDTRWIVFGGSYPGSLAAWMRAKYGHLVHGAMSASGPLLALIDFSDYFKVVDESLSTYSSECVDAVREGTNQVEILLRHMVGQRSINQKFNLCDPIEHLIDSSNDVSNLFETLAGNFAEIVQYNKDNRLGVSGKGHSITIDTLCEVMTNQTIGPAIDRLAVVNGLILNATEQKCLDYKYETMVEEMTNTSWASEQAEGGRQWTYQTCTEFGFFQTSAYRPQVFGNYFPAKFFVQQCSDIFGSKFDHTFLINATQRTNAIYGAFDIDVTNVVFVHGSIDPWHALGITKTLSQGAPAIYIKGTAHCANMYPKLENDLPQLKAARVQIADLIDTWTRL